MKRQKLNVVSIKFNLRLYYLELELELVRTFNNNKFVNSNGQWLLMVLSQQFLVVFHPRVNEIFSEFTDFQRGIYGSLEGRMWKAEKVQFASRCRKPNQQP